MALFGDNICKDCRGLFKDTSFAPVVSKEKSLKEMAIEKFGSDKRLILELELYLSERRKLKQNPSRISWGMQLDLLEKFPSYARLEQVQNSIRNGYRSIAYESSLKKYTKQDINVSCEKATEKSNIRYDVGF